MAIPVIVALALGVTAGVAAATTKLGEAAPKGQKAKGRKRGY